MILKTRTDRLKKYGKEIGLNNLKFVLKTQDLMLALDEMGIKIKKPLYYSNNADSSLAEMKTNENEIQINSGKKKKKRKAQDV
ncbi:hypothetical protein M0811_01097 [Anaeramoeba ignava]|uniref:Uncharacterized protein n=1 Tax=Anaeramoeba ignava TaxID=1746090 RepID=A0A9Q0LJC0_ANAIG|nr:hypothetical protein M0811_01097 [Anaeramoeba ignava]